MIKYILVLLLLCWVPNTSCDSLSHAAEPNSELSMLIEISNSVSSIQTSLIQIDKSSDEMKKQVSSVQSVVNDAIVKIAELQTKEIKSEVSFNKLEDRINNLEDRTQSLDLVNIKQDTSSAIITGILVFFGSAICLAIFNFLFNKVTAKKKK